MQLSKYFTKNDAQNWSRHISTMSAADKKLATSLAIKHWTPAIERNARNIALKLDDIQDALNAAYIMQYGGKLKLIITSWFRPIEWEIYRKRGGGSQHVLGHGIDLSVIGCNANDYNQIMETLFNLLVKMNWNGGLARLVRSGRYSFIHLDLGNKRRWEY
jgi:hypothetical protein